MVIPTAKLQLPNYKKPPLSTKQKPNKKVKKIRYLDKLVGKKFIKHYFSN